MPLTSRKRKVLVGVGIFLLAIVILILAIPLWLPWLLRPALSKYNVNFSSYERKGYSKLVISDLTYSTNNTKFFAKQVELFQPLTWLWKNQFGYLPNTDFARISDWKLEISPSEKKKKPKTLSEILEKTDAALPLVKRWLPIATLTNGTVHTGKEIVTVPSITWNRGLLSAIALSDKRQQNAELQAWFSTEPKQIQLKLPKAELSADLELREQNAAIEISGLVTWQTNRLKLSAEFPNKLRNTQPETRPSTTNQNVAAIPTTLEVWLPEKASLHAENFRIAASLLKLEGYQDLTGSATATWDGNRFDIDLTANAIPQRSLPPATAVIHASGSTNQVLIEQAKITAPWIKAELSKNVEMDFTGKLLSPEAALSVAIDLSKQKFFDASGQFTGEAFLSRSEKKYPKTTFHLRAVEFEGFKIHARQIELSGKLDWPLLEVQKLQANLADGGVAEANGHLDLVLKQIQKAQLKLNGDFGHAFLPPNISYTNFSLTTEIKGAFKQPSHSGQMEIRGLTVSSNLSPLTLGANWRAKHLDFDQVQLKATAKRSSLALAAAGTVGKDKAKLQLSYFTLTKLGQAMMALKQPAKISFQKIASTNKVSRFQVAVEKILWQGANRELAIEGNFALPRQARFNLAAKQLSPFLLQDFFVKPSPNIQLEELQFSGGWTNGPLDFVLRGKGEYRADETNVFAANVIASGDEAGLSFEDFKVLSEAAPVISGRGFVPIRIQPSQSNKLELRPKELVDFRADTTPHKVFWDRIAELIHVRFDDPEVHMLVTGSLEKPQGKITARAGGAEWLGKKTSKELPTIKNLQAEIHLNEEKITVNKFTLLVEGQPLSAEAQLPLGKNFSKNWKQALDWRKASGRIYAQEIEFAPFVRFAPKILAPQGTMSLNLSFSPGPELHGDLKVNNASTHALSGTGALHDLRATLRFVERRIELDEVQGFLGGQPIGIFGSIDFDEMKSDLPLIDLKLLGQNVPLSRTPEAIVRGDLNLKLSNLTNEVPVVSGQVNLRDSFYLGDVKQLLPGRVASPKKRPPYFSLDAEQIADWKLRVRVTGTNFMKIRSPLFKGSASASLRLGGTLREPVSLGDVKIESGTIQFPFANFQVTQGFVSLISDDPYRPQLFVTATSRAFSYDLQMNLRGPADEPVIEFSSTPDLTSEQIILMVTAGEVPRKDFGFSSQQKAQKLAMFLGKSLISKFSSDEGGAERLTISTGEEISETGQETYSLEYKLTDKWSLVGEYDRFGALNAGVKWRVYSK